MPDIDPPIDAAASIANSGPKHVACKHCGGKGTYLKPKRDLTYLREYQFKAGTSGNPGGIPAPFEKKEQQHLTRMRAKAEKVAARLVAIQRQIAETK